MKFGRYWLFYYWWWLTLPLYFFGGILWGLLEIFPPAYSYVTHVFWLLVLAILQFGGGAYILGEVERVHLELGSYFRWARLAIWAGFALLLADGYIFLLEFLTLKSFKSDIPFWSVLVWAHIWFGIGGVFVSGIGALSLRNKGPAQVLPDVDIFPLVMTWAASIGMRLPKNERVLAFMSSLTYSAASVGGLFFPLPSLIVFILAGIFLLSLALTSSWRFIMR